MINYKYNETAYAELVFKNGFQTKHIPTELRLLVLYFRDILKLKPKEREEFTYEFCKKYISNFKKEKFFKTINKSLKSALKKEQKLVDVDKIEIYKNEIDYLNSLDIKHEYKKVMFTFLIQMRLNKLVYEYKYDKEYNSIFFKGGNKKYNNIKKLSNIPIKMSINDEVINGLGELGLITILHKGTISLDYLKNCVQEGDVAITITDYENVGLYLDYYNKVKGIIQCENCNKIIKQTNNKMKYCKGCAEKIKNEQNKKYYHLGK